MPRIPLLPRSATVFATCALAVAACGSSTADEPPVNVTPPLIIATTSIWADVTSEALCGIDVPALIPAGADPHTFEPSLSDRELIERADLVVANGGGLEDSLIDLLTTAAAGGTNLVELTPFVDVITLETRDDPDHDDPDHDDPDHDDGHGHGLEVDPHIWQDPNRVVSAVEVIVSAGRALGLDDCADDYTVALFELDKEIEDLLAPIPPERRQMVTNHDSLAYLADRYEIEVIGTVIPATSVPTQTNAADLAALADLIDERGIAAIFIGQSASTADELAERLGVVVVPIVTEALTDHPASDTYLEMMRSNATLIAQALST